MVKKRLIPCLDVTKGRVVKGVRFVELRDIGDPVEMATLYSEYGADELVFLDITATVFGHDPSSSWSSGRPSSSRSPSPSVAVSSTLEHARRLLASAPTKLPSTVPRSSGPSS